jgi:ParB family transcriptional regulator, chromosome partitioning protein
MAKRKRLSPAAALPPQAPASGVATSPFPPASGIAAPPIAQVSAQAASTAALTELSDMVTEARASGRLLEALPLDAIEMHHILRDRMGMYGEELDVLVASLRARGQSTPIEVTPLPDQPGRYGLISGYRRMAALRKLAQEDPSFDTVKAQVISHGSAQAAYVAMVEENEVRVDLSPYERAHMVVRALENGLFSDEKDALQTLYEHVTRSKRSRIKALMPLVRALGDALRHPAHLSERMGLALVKAVGADADLGVRLRDLLAAQPEISPAEEAALMERVLGDKPVLQSQVDAAAEQALEAKELADAPVVKPRQPQVSFDPNKGMLQVTGADEGLFEAVKRLVRDFDDTVPE